MNKTADSVDNALATGASMAGVESHNELRFHAGQLAFLAEKGNLQSYAAKVQELWANPETRMAGNAALGAYFDGISGTQNIADVAQSALNAQLKAEQEIGAKHGDYDKEINVKENVVGNFANPIDPVKVQSDLTQQFNDSPLMQKVSHNISNAQTNTEQEKQAMSEQVSGSLKEKHETTNTTAAGLMAKDIATDNSDNASVGGTSSVFREPSQSGLDPVTELLATLTGSSTANAASTPFYNAPETNATREDDTNNQGQAENNHRHSEPNENTHNQAEKDRSGSVKGNHQSQSDEDQRHLAQGIVEENPSVEQKNKATRQAENQSQENHQNQDDHKKSHKTKQKSANIDSVSGSLKDTQAEDLRTKAIDDIFNQVQLQFSEIEAKYADEFEKWNKKHPNKLPMGERFYWDYIHEKRAAFGEFHQELHGLNIKLTDLPQKIKDWEQKTHFNLNVMNEEPLGNVYPELALLGGVAKWSLQGLWNGGKALIGSQTVKQVANSVKNGVAGAGSFSSLPGSVGRVVSGESYSYSNTYDKNMCNALYKIAEYPNNPWVNGKKSLWTKDIGKEKDFLKHIGVPYEVNGVDMAYFLMENRFARSAGKTGLSLGKFTQATVGFMGVLGLDTYSAVGTVGNEKGRKISELRTDQKGTAMGYEASFYKNIKTFADAKCKAPRKGKK